MNIPRLREYLFTGCFFSFLAALFPTGKHPHNCMFLIYPKKTKEKKIHTYIYVYMVLFYMYKDTQHRERKKNVCHLSRKKKKRGLCITVQGMRIASYLFVKEKKSDG
jgi:hypothetical protein